jgi:hypothetical protein
MYSSSRFINVQQTEHCLLFKDHTRFEIRPVRCVESVNGLTSGNDNNDTTLRTVSSAKVDEIVKSHLFA